MYYIVVYDVADKKRLPKVLRCCRQFLHWIQNSVFEGEMTRSQYLNFKNQIKKIIKRNEDSVIFFAIRNTEVYQKEILGKNKNEISNFF